MNIKVLMYTSIKWNFDMTGVSNILYGNKASRLYPVMVSFYVVVMVLEYTSIMGMTNGL